MALYPVILAGGSGTRLWPLSRQRLPKQFLTLLSERTLLQETLSRLDGMTVADPLIVCNEAHGFLASGQSNEIEKKVLCIILEPEGRNTAPALTLAALFLKDFTADQSLDPVMLVMPADHVIKDVQGFQAAVAAGVGLAERGYLVTFGIVPHLPHTGYGYIQKGKPIESAQSTSDNAQGHTPLELRAFVEKPDLSTARAYLESGDYLWNSGIFLMRSSVWLRELERCRPDIARACISAYNNAQRDVPFLRPDSALFTACPSESIDYAVMEKIAGDSETQGAVVSLDAGWSDLGSWSEVWEQGDRDAHGNVVQGDVYLESVDRSLLLAHHRLLAAVGLEDVVVVETDDAVLVAHRDRVQEVREIVDRLKTDQRPEQGSPRKVLQPWGSYRVMEDGPGFQVKHITINPGCTISLHNTIGKEQWVVVKGTANITTGRTVQVLGRGESAVILPGAAHRVENTGVTPLEVVAVVIIGSNEDKADN